MTTVDDTTTMHELRRHPAEWRRRGLTPPVELAMIVTARVSGASLTRTPSMLEPMYADFFSAA